MHAANAEQRRAQQMCPRRLDHTLERTGTRRMLAHGVRAANVRRLWIDEFAIVMAETPAAEQLRVFISYSRRDLAFADRLVAALAAAGFSVKIDRQDLPKLEDWQRELQHLIRQADTVILVMSGHSLASPIVEWEIEQVRSFGKRLAPVVIADISEMRVPPELARLNYVFFTDDHAFDKSVSELAAALRLDVVWLKEHTRIGELAWWWNEHQMPADALMRGVALDEAIRWSMSRPPHAPAVTPQQHSFLAASQEFKVQEAGREKKQRSSRRKVLGSLALALILGSGYAAWSNRPTLRSWLADIVEWADPRALGEATERALKDFDTFSECRGCPTMVVLPAGAFSMGSPADETGHKSEESPLHRVTISQRFAVAKFEITFEQWEVCVEQGGCTYHPDDLDFGRGTQPVINIAWDDAKQYAQWLARRTGRPYRLLSEAEWEYAARAGNDAPFTWGDTIGQGNANCANCGTQWDDRATAPVGSFAPNAFGLHDMYGNVWEWVEDCWHPTYDKAPSDGSAWTSDCADGARRVVRGGSWDDVPADLRSAARYAPGKSARTRVNGIRVGRAMLR
jgi:formylglycine-generating enzyme required for sulfatase activity